MYNTSMNKESLLNDLHDLILTLKSPNFEDASVKVKWQKKYESLIDGINLLSIADQCWMDERHRDWMINHLGEKVEDFSWL